MAIMEEGRGGEDMVRPTVLQSDNHTIDTNASRIWELEQELARVLHQLQDPDAVYGDFNLSSTYISPNNITRFSGSSVTLYTRDSSGLSLALADSLGGDIIIVPPGTYANNYSIPAGVAVVGRSPNECIITGQVSIANGGSMESVHIFRSLDDASAIYGIVGGTDANVILRNVKVDVANATGAAYAVYMALGGRIDAFDTELLAETGSDGYAVYITDGDFYHYGGRAIGTAALTPYFY